MGFRSLRLKLLFFFLVFSLVPLALVGWLSYQRSRDTLAESQSRLLVQSASDSLGRIEASLFERYGDAQAFALSGQARGTPEEVTGIANEYTKAYGCYDLMIVADADGKVIAVNTVDYEGKPVRTAGLLGRSVKGEEWFEACLGGKIKPGQTYTSDLAVDLAVADVTCGRGLVLNYSTPVVDEKGQVVRVWSNRASWDRIVGDLMQLQQKKMKANGMETAEVQILSRRGLLLYDADPAAVLNTNLADLGLEAARRGASPDHGGQTGYTIETHRRTGTVQINAYASAARDHPSQLGHVVLARQATAEAFAGAVALRDYMFWIAGISAAVILVVGLVLAHGVAAPVRRTAEAVEALARGDLTREVRARGRDEVGRVARSFTSAVRDIRQALGAERVDWPELLRQQIEMVRVRTMVENSPVGMMYLDPQGVIRYLNPTLTKALAPLAAELGVTPDRVLGQPVTVFRTWPDADRRALASPDRLPHEARVRMGAETLDLKGIAIRDAAGQYLGTMVVVEVVTQRLATEKLVNLGRMVGYIKTMAGVAADIANRDVSAEVKPLGPDDQFGNAFQRMLAGLNESLAGVADAVGQVRAASGQIADGSQSLAHGAQQQAASLEEISSSLEQITGMTRQNADNATQARALAGEAATAAEGGTEAMRQMEIAIGRIEESSAQTAKILKTIDEIAFQTNLLALNAAVEAARAGEAGKGFAVVAEEVRNLAQRSADAAKTTADMIEASVRNSRDGVRLSKEVGQALAGISRSSKKVNGLIAEVAAACQEQAQGVEQINQSVLQLDSLTQQTAASSEESASSAEELSSQAEELTAMVGAFRLRDGAGADDVAASPAWEPAAPPARSGRRGPPAPAEAAPRGASRRPAPRANGHAWSGHPG